MTVRPAPEHADVLDASPVTNIPALTGIRALAAGWVVLGHFKDPLFGLLPASSFLSPLARQGGGLGVEVFFILSGFIISHNYAESFARRRGSYRRFLRARIARIYPVHLVTLLVMGVLVLGAALTHRTLVTSAYRNTPGNFLGNALVLQALPGFAAINVPAWSVCCESAAYVLFPLLAVRAFRLSGRAALGGAAAVLAAGMLTLLWLGWTGRFREGDDYPVMWVRITCEFSTGVLLWVWWRRRSGGPSAWWDAAAVVGVVATGAVCCLTGDGSPGVFLSLPAIALFVVACASASGPLARFLAGAPMQWLGRVSYSLYMTHFIVFVVIDKLVRWRELTGGPLLGRIGLLLGWGALVLVAAVATFYLVEEPGRKLLRRSTRRPAPVGA